MVPDVFSSHRNQEAKAKADELSIQLVFVPASGTSLNQPLYRRIYGPVKQRTRKEYEIARKRRREGNVWSIEQLRKPFQWLYGY